MEQRYVTIVGFSSFFGHKPFVINNIICCVKEPNNPYDSDAISANVPLIGRVGYLANKPDTIAGGTMTAGRIYDSVDDKFYVRVMFTTKTKIICKIEQDDEELFEQEIKNQLSQGK